MRAYLCAKDESMTLHDLSMNCKMGTKNKRDQYLVKKDVDNNIYIINAHVSSETNLK
jgi:hypothetical protein